MCGDCDFQTHQSNNLIYLFSPYLIQNIYTFIYVKSFNRRLILFFAFTGTYSHRRQYLNNDHMGDIMSSQFINSEGEKSFFQTKGIILNMRCTSSCDCESPSIRKDPLVTVSFISLYGNSLYKVKKNTIS